MQFVLRLIQRRRYGLWLRQRTLHQPGQRLATLRNSAQAANPTRASIEARQTVRLPRAAWAFLPTVATRDKSIANGRPNRVGGHSKGWSPTQATRLGQHGVRQWSGAKIALDASAFSRPQANPWVKASTWSSSVPGKANSSAVKSSSQGAAFGSLTEPPANESDWAIRRAGLSVSGVYLVTLIELSSRLWIRPLLIGEILDQQRSSAVALFDLQNPAPKIVKAQPAANDFISRM